MKKRGFTLVELLAVIAILAILVIMALPAVLRMFRQARMQSFTNEVRSIYSQAQKQIIADSLNLDAGGEKVYASDITTNTSTRGSLELQGGDKIKYCVVLDNSGNIKKLYVSNGTYMYMSESPNALKNVENIEAIDISGEDFITGLENCVETESAMFDTGQNVNAKMKQLANSTETDVTYEYPDTNITAIKHSTVEPTSANKEAKNKVSSAESDLDIYMWFEDGVIYWWSEDNTPSLNSDSSWMFNRLTSLIDINGLSMFDTSRATTFFAMFLGNTYAKMHLPSLKALSNWNTSNVTDMSGMFQQNISLTTLEGLENWDVSNVITMYLMFGGHSNSEMNIKSLKPLSNWDTSNVTNMRAMFQLNMGLTSLEGLENWDVSNVTTMQSMFYQNTGLASLEGLENWNTSKVESMRSTFYGCSNLTSAEKINFWNINKVNDFKWLFGIYDNGENVLNSVHPTFKYLDENGIEHDIAGSWSSNGTFVKE